jgi:hypothetical protein
MGDFKDLHEMAGEVLPVSQESPAVTSPGHQNMAKHALPIHPVHRTAAKRFKAAVWGPLLGPGVNNRVLPSLLSNNIHFSNRTAC